MYPTICGIIYTVASRILFCHFYICIVYLLTVFCADHILRAKYTWYELVGPANLHKIFINFVLKKFKLQWNLFITDTL